MLLHFYAIGLLLLALLPAAMMFKNLPLFRKLIQPDHEGLAAKRELGPTVCLPLVSVLIPARDEERSIAECVQHALACDSAAAPCEVIVMDDGSTDRTFLICESIGDRDPRMRVARSAPLPVGWNGKQHACWQLANLASGRWFLFLDADVRLAPDAIVRLMTQVEAQPMDLLSGFPRQVTGTFFERLLIPLMHFILLGYLPFSRMRSSPGPEFAAGCGQLFLARREAYEASGGHRAIAASRHDGIKLPRAFRLHGATTDVFDASDIATCRMYDRALAVLRGLAKNATEGIGSPPTIVPFTILLASAAVLPVVSWIVGWMRGWNAMVMVELTIATVLSLAPRLMAARYFHQSWSSALLHPLGVGLFLAIQWWALLAHALGHQTRWRGRL